MDGEVLNQLVHAPKVWMEAKEEEIQSQMGYIAEISVTEDLYLNFMEAFVQTEHIVQVCTEVSEDTSVQDRVLCVINAEYGDVY